MDAVLAVIARAQKLMVWLPRLRNEIPVHQRPVQFALRFDDRGWLRVDVRDGERDIEYTMHIRLDEDRSISTEV
jgi:hypothetical protein